MRYWVFTATNIRPVSESRHWSTADTFSDVVIDDRTWSWLDLLVLRSLDWLNRSTPSNYARIDGNNIKSIIQQLISMKRLSIARLRDLEIWGTEGTVSFNIRHIHQGLMPMNTYVFAPMEPYGHGPGLLEPRQNIRITPGKLNGEPHVAGTRLQSQSLYSLYLHGHTREAIMQIHPNISAEVLNDALNLEVTLQRTM